MARRLQPSETPAKLPARPEIPKTRNPSKKKAMAEACGGRTHQPVIRPPRMKIQYLHHLSIAHRGRRRQGMTSIRNPGATTRSGPSGPPPTRGEPENERPSSSRKKFAKTPSSPSGPLERTGKRQGAPLPWDSAGCWPRGRLIATVTRGEITPGLFLPSLQFDDF